MLVWPPSPTVSRSKGRLRRSNWSKQNEMAAAAWPGIASSQCALLLPRSPPAAGFALAPAPGTSMRRRRHLHGVCTPAAAVLQDGAATLFVTAGAYTLVRAFDMLTDRRLVQQVSSFTTLLPVLIYCKIQIFWPLYASCHLVFGWGVILIPDNSTFHELSAKIPPITQKHRVNGQQLIVAYQC
jgi:hypothetical protein